MSIKKIFLNNACHSCGANDFSKKGNLRRHLKEQHDINSSFSKNTTVVPPTNSEFTDTFDENTIKMYACPFCEDYFESLTHLDNHINDKHLKKEEVEDDPAENVFLDSHSKSDYLPIVDPTINVTLTDNNPVIIKSARTYDSAVLNACGQLVNNNKESAKTLYIVDNLSLQPFTISSKDGKEQNALAHSSVIKDLERNCEFVGTNFSQKRKLEEEDDMLCITCTKHVQGTLGSMLLNSPYTKLLCQRNYVELSPEISSWLNRDWEFYPQVKFATAKLFSGSILYNTNAGQAVICNTVEAYGRTKVVDSHCEPNKIIKGKVQATSLPPLIIKLYPDIWPVSLKHPDGQKLCIGTQVSNILITSCTRIDTKQASIIGSTNSHFSLLSKKDSLSTKIFVDQECVEAALNLLKDTNTSQVNTMGIMYQLRQIRSKFHLSNTYYLCRASGPLTKSHSFQPVTVFTLAGHNQGRNAVASLFYSIGLHVLRHGIKSRLSKATIIASLAKSSGKNKKLLEEILLLFVDTEDIEIIGNMDLNSILEKLADLLMPTIVAANNSVCSHVNNIFEFYD